MATATMATGKQRYKLLIGNHHERVGKTPDGRPIFKHYKRGDIVESSIDLEARFNAPGSIKFELIREQVPVIKTVVMDLETMTLDELRNYAQDEEIDLPETAKDRASILKAIRTARSQRQQSR